MKIIFFGSGLFAVESLKILLSAGYDIKLVVTQPDARQGRHMLVKGTPVKNYALSQNLQIFQPDNINENENRKVIEAQDADIFIVVSYGRILDKAVLHLAKKMAINIHASLLPRYRGASPINQALMNGDVKTGITFIRMNEFMDEGDIILQKELHIDKTDNAVTLEEKLSRMAAVLLLDVLSLLKKGGIHFIRQDPALATYAPLLKKRDGLILWNKKAQDVINAFRACFGWPGSYAYFHGSVLKITQIEMGRQNIAVAKPGEVIALGADFIEVACLSGSVYIKEVLPQSHKRMPVRSFLAGHKIKIGELFQV